VHKPILRGPSSRIKCVEVFSRTVVVICPSVRTAIATVIARYLSVLLLVFFLFTASVHCVFSISPYRLLYSISSFSSFVFSISFSSALCITRRHSRADPCDNAPSQNSPALRLTCWVL